MPKLTKSLPLPKVPATLLLGVGAACGIAIGGFAAFATPNATPNDAPTAPPFEAPAIAEVAPDASAKPALENGKAAPTEPTKVAKLAAPKLPSLPPLIKRAVTDEIRAGETLSVALTRHGVTMDEVNRLVVDLKKSFNVRGIRPGDIYSVEQVHFEGKSQDINATKLAMDVFEFRPKNAPAPTVIRAVRQAGKKTYAVSKDVAPITTKTVALTGTVKTSLYDAMRDEGEGIALVNAFVDVFAWDVDFYRETQKGDRYKVVVEKRYADGRFVGYGKVRAAEYTNYGHIYRGFDFESKDGEVRGIFDDNGRAMEKTFIKNPMEIARITSSYGQRFHPVLRRLRKHNGVDYGAPRGTPFWAVADGVVKEARYSRSAGNMIVLRHNNGYETEYFHASRFAKGLKKGMKVKQRDVIGYVGSTGRSTGPHLHFGMRKRGHHVNPGKQNFPAAKPVPAKYVDEYLESIRGLAAELEALATS